MSPDSISQKRAQKRERFSKLLEEVKNADSKVLRLFPSLDFNATAVGPQAKKGLGTALRVLLVTAEDGYVNENELSKYGMGGDSRHKMLPRLLRLGLLVRSEEESEKGGKKFVHHLSGKGVLLCAAFRRILVSEAYVSLIKERVTDKSLANTMLFLYGKPTGSYGKQLLQALHVASDMGLNLENLDDAGIAGSLLQADEDASTDHGEILVFKHLPEVVDMLARANDSQIEILSRLVAEVIKGAHAEPDKTKASLNLIGELRRIIRSPDFQIIMRTPDGFARFIAIGQESYRSELRDLMERGDPVGVFLEKGKLFFEEFRRRLRQECLSRIAEMKQEGI